MMQEGSWASQSHGLCGAYSTLPTPFDSRPNLVIAMQRGRLNHEGVRPLMSVRPGSTSSKDRMFAGTVTELVSWWPPPAINNWKGDYTGGIRTITSIINHGS